MNRPRTWVALAALLLLVPLLLAACGGDGEEAAPPGEAETAEPAEPIVIGAAVDLTNQMAPFDGPAITAAELQVEKINGAGGVNGRQLELRVIDHQLDPEKTKAAAIDLIEQGAEVLIVTCDVDFATPAVQESISRGLLTVSPCISTDQMGPARFGDQGRLAFTVGSLAQEEGAVLAEWAFDQGHRTAITIKDNVIVYFQDVVEAFEVRFKELGGEVVLEEEWTQGDGTIGNVVSSVANADADVIATSTAFDDLPALVSGLRSLGDDRPIFCSWSCDGEYWIPEGLSNFTVNSYASVFGDDPSDEVKDLIQRMTDAGQPPATGGFVLGAAAIDAIAAAIEQTGTTEGAQLAEAFEGFEGQPTISGEINYSEQFHAVFGRPFRIITYDGGQASFAELKPASSPADIG